ncbi:MAG TPA: DUF4134 family protein [Mucilaginibacter sp.]|jgi:hypothetical protein|nr:DUF4134 family protein [Mucilaginibacter sp.]
MNKMKRLWAAAAVMALGTGAAFAQNGVTGINSATTSLKTYVDPVTNVTLVIGGIVGIVGAIRVYSKWNSGDQDDPLRFGQGYLECRRRKLYAAGQAYHDGIFGEHSHAVLL